ncbi:hypothetical protein D1007_31370 [Hordeum vulgare]|nr:hypothetical protein D1007_31370 [Hordeum vulgare]
MKQARRAPLADKIETKYTMLDPVFDKGLRDRFIENGMMLPPMRMRGHGTIIKMVYDERYTSFYKSARLLGFVLQFKRKPPLLVHSALTDLIDRWRLDIHSFHLPCGEITVTLWDWGMITALPIDDRALTGRVDRRNWEDRVIALIGDCPPAKANRTSDLDDATQRMEASSGMYGCSWALSIWMWERILVGHPEKLKPREWEDYGKDDGDETRYLTVACAWDWVGAYTGTSKALYKVFTNDIDALAPFQVSWEPYAEREWGFQLNVMCRHGRLLWRCIVPMICVYAVEYHMPHRVAAHMSRQKNQSIVDWGETRDKYVKEWNDRKGHKDAERRVIDSKDYEMDRLWYDDGSKYRLHLRPLDDTICPKSLR